MIIAICGSIAFYDEMLNIKKKLEQLGHLVQLPPLEIPDEISYKEEILGMKPVVINHDLTKIK